MNWALLALAAVVLYGTRHLWRFAWIAVRRSPEGAKKRRRSGRGWAYSSATSWQKGTGKGDRCDHRP